ncbi:hypothetical protein TWF506_006041 [Arthrobotrys conoides]|uniref:F-box domain-containing protein n=1 Tax=Arthrobotrys conoides TaxID=74498 RepID=A0AAN8NG63_9PEZI
MQRSAGSKKRTRHDPFRVFPAELNILILKDLSRKDLYSLSRCSKLCYLLCFPRRFDAGTITLTDGSIRLFQDGGLFEQYRTTIRSIHFSKTVTGTQFRPLGTDQEVSEAITQIRIWMDALSLFPKIQELHVSYTIPAVMEKNVYTAVMSAITAQSFYKDLECLEFHIHKDTETSYSSDSATLDLYEDIFTILSPENQTFLGPKIPDDAIDELIKAKVPELPSLTSARISVDGLRSPLINLKTTSCEGSLFYYIPLTRAPNLEYLWVETLTVSPKPHCDISNTNTLKEYKEKVYADPNQLHSFPSVTKLQLIADGIPSKEEIDSLPQIFPNLEVLEISQLKLSKREGGDETSSDGRREHRYDGIGKLKHLVDLTMPWPAYEGIGSIHPVYLSEWIYRWIGDEARKLNVVAFEGTRHIFRPERQHEIRVTCEIGAAGVKVDLKGDTSISEFQDPGPALDYLHM